MNNKFYFVDDKKGGEIYSIDLANPNNKPTLIEGATSTKENLVLDSKNNVIYFVNTSDGRSLYQIEPSQEPKKVVNDSISSVKYDSNENKLLYTTFNNKKVELNVDATE